MHVSTNIPGPLRVTLTDMTDELTGTKLSFFSLSVESAIELHSRLGAALQDVRNYQRRMDGSGEE